MMNNLGIIDMADIPYVPSWKIVEDDFKKYGWEENKEYLQKRLAYIFKQLGRGYDLELAREKQSLYFVNSDHINFMDEMGCPSNWARFL